MLWFEASLASTLTLEETFDDYPPNPPFMVDGLNGGAGHTNYLGQDALWMEAYFPVGRSAVRTLIYSYDVVHFLADSVVEIRLDLLQFESAEDYVELGFLDTGDALAWVTYTLKFNSRLLVLEKQTPWRPVSYSLFLAEEGPFKDDLVTLVLRFAAIDDTLAIQVQLLDQEAGNAVLFDRTVRDTPGSDPVFPAPNPFPRSTADVGGPFLNTFWSWFGIGAPAGTGSNTKAIFDNYRRTSTRLGLDEMVAGVFTNASGLTLPYRLLVPPGYDPTNRYPLVLSLHGAGGTGSDNRLQVEDQPGFLALASPRNQQKQPCFLLAPQTPSDWLTVADRVLDLLEDLQSRYPIDPDRLYVTGLSMGGSGTTDLLAYRPDVFAAGVPLSGASNGKARQIAHIPVWAFCGAQDTSFIYSVRQLVETMREAGARTIYTEYARAGHVIWTAAYQTPGLFDWLMAQRRGAPQSGLPELMIQNPIAGETWTTWSQVLDLSGIVSADVETTSVEVKNLTLNTTQKATGSNAWSVAGMALAPGATNILVVKAVGPSRAANLPGATSLSDTLTLLQQQLVLQATIESERRILRWTVGAPPCVIEHCAGLGASNWVQVETNTGSEAWLPWSIEPAFYRVRLLEP